MHRLGQRQEKDRMTDRRSDRKTERTKCLERTEFRPYSLALPSSRRSLTSLSRQTFRMMFFRYSTYRMPYQNSTNARAKASEAFKGLSHEAKTV